MPRAATNRLQVVTRTGTAQLWIRGTIRGRRIYESAGTTDAGVAEQVRRAREDALWREILDGERSASAPREGSVSPRKREAWTFADACESYLNKKPPRPTEARNLGKLLDHFQDWLLDDIDQIALDNAYAAILTPKAGPATRLRAVLTPLRTILRHAARRKMCAVPLFETPKVGEGRVVFLLPSQARALVEAAADHVKPLITFLLCTGARMAEALELDWSEVDLRGRRAVIVVKGERVADDERRRTRHVDLTPAVIAALSTIRGRTGRVFKPHKGGKISAEAYWDSDRTGGGQIKRAWSGASLRAGLPGRWRIWTPKGQDEEKREFVPKMPPHGTRHTWASWHYAVHKDVLLLQRDGDWRTAALCTRYAHLIPNGYRDEIEAFWGTGEASVREVG